MQPDPTVLLAPCNAPLAQLVSNVVWRLLSPLCVVKDTTRWLELQVALSVSLVKSALLPLLPDQLALQVNTQWLCLPFARTVQLENSARLALPKIVGLAATA